MAAHVFGDAGVISAETKYDGERMQIHVELPAPGDQSDKVSIKIFSKSGRDSTWDRVETHAIVLAALGIDPLQARRVKGRDLMTVPNEHLIEESGALLSQRFKTLGLAGGNTGQKKAVRRRAILEGEMVAWDETRNQVAEFYKIAQIKDKHGLGGFIEGPGRQHKKSKTEAAAVGEKLSKEENERALHRWKEAMKKQRQMLLDQIEEDMRMGQVFEDIEVELRSRIQQ